MDRVVEILTKYRDATVMLIDEIKNDGDMEKYLEERALIISEIENEGYKKESILEQYTKIGLDELEIIASNELKNLRDSVKEEMIKLKRNKAAAMEYNSNYKNVNFLNKQI